MNANYKSIISAISLFFALSASISAAPGDLDPTFGNGGIVITRDSNRYQFDYALGMAIQSDGKIVVVGEGNAGTFNWDFAVVRYSPDGSLDASFGGTGIVTPFGEGGANSVAIQRDGKIVAAGGVGDVTGDDFAVVRLNPNGSPDTTFNGTGRVITSIDFRDYVSGAAIQPDGKIVVAGFADNGSDFFDYVVVRYQGDAPPAACPNPIDCAEFYVRQHYRDFLGREPDDAGLAFWTNEITSCGSDAGCVDAARVSVSAAFFLSIEFQETGFLAYRAHKAAFGDIAGQPVPVTRDGMLQDMLVIGGGVVVNAEGWGQKLEQNKQAYFAQLAASPRFTTLYPQSMAAEQLVDALDANAGGALSQAERDALVAELNGGATTRAQALRTVAEDANLAKAEFNRAFALMQYFGYLRRNPSDAPDTDFGGYNFWLQKLDEFQGNFIEAEMVKAFLDSTEYRRRFGQN